MTDTPKAYETCPVCHGERKEPRYPCPRCRDQGVGAVHNASFSAPYGWQVPPHRWS